MDYTSIDKFSFRKKKLLTTVLGILIGCCSVFTLTNLIAGRSMWIVIFNLFFSISFIPLLYFVKNHYQKVILAVALLYQAFIFGHSFFLLPGKQIETGLGLMVCLGPIFLLGTRLWILIFINFLLYHISIYYAEYEDYFFATYAFYLIVLIIVKMLVESNMKFESTLIEQNKRIVTDAEELKRSEAYRTKFFTNITHEFRTPITLILAPITGLLSHVSDTQIKDQLSLIKKNARSLLHNVNQLLEFTKMDQEESVVDKEIVHISVFFKDLTLRFSAEATNKNISFTNQLRFEEGTYLLVDKLKLHMIISNLLSNALKFTEQGGRVTIIAFLEKNDLKVIVEDTGIGIPIMEKESVFDRFHQVNRIDYTEGTGIGLALVKELTEILEGDIHFEDNLPKGSRFILRLPVEKTSVMPSATERGSPVFDDQKKDYVHTFLFTEGRPSILVVEDNNDMRNYVGSLFNDQYNVTLAKNGVEGLDHLKSCDDRKLPILIITDIMMPRMNGMEFIKNIKAEGRLKNIPVIALTAINDHEFEVSSLRIGIDDYITKPFINEELVIRSLNLIRNYYERGEVAVDSSTKNENKIPTTESNSLLDKIEQHVMKLIGTKSFKIEQLASELNMSPKSLQIKVKAITGLTPKKYQRAIILNHAKELITTGAVLTVSELAYKVGFEDPHYFSTIYRLQYGISPKEEIKKIKNN